MLRRLGGAVCVAVFAVFCLLATAEGLAEGPELRLALTAGSTEVQVEIPQTDGSVVRRTVRTTASEVTPGPVGRDPSGRATPSVPRRTVRSRCGRGSSPAAGGSAVARDRCRWPWSGRGAEGRAPVSSTKRNPLPSAPRILVQMSFNRRSGRRQHRRGGHGLYLL